MQANAASVRKSIREANKLLNQILRLVPRKDRAKALVIADSILILMELRLLELLRKRP